MKFSTLFFIALLLLGSKCQSTQTVTQDMQNILNGGTEFLKGFTNVISTQLKSQAQKFVFEIQSMPETLTSLLMLIKSIVDKIYTGTMGNIYDAVYEIYESWGQIPFDTMLKTVGTEVNCKRNSDGVSISFFGALGLMFHIYYYYDDYKSQIESIINAFNTNQYEQAGEQFGNILIKFGVISPMNIGSMIQRGYCSLIDKI